MSLWVSSQMSFIGKTSIWKKESYSNGGHQYKRLFNCNIDKNLSDYVDILYSHVFYPTVNSSTQITTNSKTSTDIIFYNVAKNISGNIRSSISNHFTQFLLISNQNPFSKHKI